MVSGCAGHGGQHARLMAPSRRIAVRRVFVARIRDTPTGPVEEALGVLPG